VIDFSSRISDPVLEQRAVEVEILFSNGKDAWGEGFRKY
jgi:hypothetical protein